MEKKRQLPPPFSILATVSTGPSKQYQNIQTRLKRFQTTRNNHQCQKDVLQIRAIHTYAHETSKIAVSSMRKKPLLGDKVLLGNLHLKQDCSRTSEHFLTAPISFDKCPISEKGLTRKSPTGDSRRAMRPRDVKLGSRHSHLARNRGSGWRVDMSLAAASR